MAYIGNVPTTAAFPFDQFSGTGAQVAFTLSQAPASTTSIAVTVSGVVQNPNTYSVSGTTLTFTEAPPSGTDNIGVLFLGLPAIVGIPSDGVVTPAMLSTGGPYWGTDGKVGLGTTTLGGNNGTLHAAVPITGATNSAGIRSAGAVQSDVTNIAQYFRAVVSVPVGSTPSTVVGYSATQATIAGTVATQVGFRAEALLVGGSTNNYGFQGLIPSGTGRYNFYASGTAANYFAGETTIDSDLKFNSGYGSAATAYGCRAWVNFNGTGTVAIRGSGNVSSITDHAVGEYSVNFATAMPDINFAYTHAYSNEVNVVHTVGYFQASSAGAIRVRHYNPANSGQSADKTEVDITIFR